MASLKHFRVLIVLIPSIIFACVDGDQAPPTATESLAASASSIYTGGEILTMSGDHIRYVDAVAIKDDKILATGKLELLLAQHKGDTTEIVDLKGNTMMPGFIEPHVHPSIAAIVLSNEIIAPYDWKLPDETKQGAQSHDEFVDRLTRSVESRAQSEKVFFVWGYHQLWHGELSRDLLNKIAPDQALAVIHRSFHEIFLNDAAISKLNIQRAEYENHPQVDWDKGHFYESGWMALVPAIAPHLLNPADYLKGLGLMSKLVVQNGITTIAEPGFPSSSFDGEYQMLKTEMDKQPPYSVYLIPSGTRLHSTHGGSQGAHEFIETLSERYNTSNINFLPKQVKLFADGAIYSQLMQLSEGYTDGHEGEWITPLNLLEEQLSFYWDQGYKIHVHANGDKGIQQVLNFNQRDQQRTPRTDHRLTLHHMGYFTPDNARQLASQRVEASVNPFYLWALAEKYSKHGLGPERGEYLVSMKSLSERNVPVSFHSDFSMAPIEPLTLAWTAVNRLTSSGRMVSQDQRIDVFTAMQAITINAARSLNLENELGSIEAGKTANFTLLAENPFKIDPVRLKDVEVVGTVFQGKHF